MIMYVLVHKCIYVMFFFVCFFFCFFFFVFCVCFFFFFFFVCFFEYFCHVSSEGHLVERLVELKMLPSQNNVQMNK